MTDTPRHEGERIAKVIARAGLASRREAEAWIAAGRVAVNDAAITSPALNVTGADRITVDGEPLRSRERTRLFLFNKPRGLVTTHSDPQGRPTIFGALPKDLPRLISVGRLDLSTEGLLLLTNDGGLARVLELPATAWLRRYRVRAFGTVTQEALDRLRAGITIDGVHYGPVEATLDREQGSNVWLTFAIREGKNREVRKVLESLGLKVNRLIRVSFGPFQLGELEDGAVEEVKTAVLREQLGPLAPEAGCDFDAPIAVPESPTTYRRSDARAGRRLKHDLRGNKSGASFQPRKRVPEDEEPKRPHRGQKRSPRDRRGSGPRPSRPR
jgi:23S rRNA pseudouridine2605 synthase